MSDKKKLVVWSITGVFITFIIIGGWHFLYSHGFKSGITAAIAPVNESPWEHAKLFFMPAIIWYTVLYFIVGKKFPNFIFSHAVVLPVMPAIMLLLFYGYQLVLPESLAIDIVISFIVAALGQLIALCLTVSKCALSGAGYRIAALAVVLAMLGLFIFFTYNPPQCDIFLDRKYMKYGI